MRFTILAAILSLAVQARPLTPQEKREEFQSLGALMRNQYGPLEYKKARFGLDLDQLVSSYGKRAETLSNRDFYYLINKFVAEFKDSHFRSAVQTDHVSSLGFVGDRVEGKVVIDYVQRNIVSQEDFPFDRGDEVVSIDGKPASQVVAELAKYVSAGYDEYALRIASMLVGYRPGSTVPPVKGEAEVVMLKNGEKTPVTVTLEWRQFGNDNLDDDTWGRHSASDTNYRDVSINDIVEELPHAEQQFRCSGLTRVAVPPGAKMLMTSPFVAYYHPTPKGNVGYLRIPHYLWNGGNDNDLRFKQYEFIIDQLEKNTVGLVIDQAHNCGGAVDLVERMVGLFVDKPYRGMQFQFLTSRNEQEQFKQFLDSPDSKNTLDGIDLQKIFKLITTSATRLTDKTTFHADRLLYPNPVHYSKPIVMLIDEMSGSGGDAFPAMMQGYGRAKLFGKRTMGAGGHVASMGSLNYSANTVNMTKSLFYHPNGTAIENNGAAPDVPYEITMYDYLNEYRNYQKAYLATLAAMIPEKN